MATQTPLPWSQTSQSASASLSTVCWTADGQRWKQVGPKASAPLITCTDLSRWVLASVGKDVILWELLIWKGYPFVSLNLTRSWVNSSQHPSSRRMQAIKASVFTSVQLDSSRVTLGVKTCAHNQPVCACKWRWTTWKCNEYSSFHKTIKLWIVKYDDWHFPTTGHFCNL